MATMKGVGVLVLAVMAFTACGVGPAGPVAEHRHALTLALADLPAGWSVDPEFTNLTTNPRDLVGDSSDVSPYTRNGWIANYSAGFKAPVGAPARKFYVLVNLFHDPGGASGYWNGCNSDGCSGDHRQLDPGATSVPGAPHLGQDWFSTKVLSPYSCDKRPSAPGSSTAVITCQSPAATAVEYTFNWRDRNVVVFLRLDAPVGTITDGEASDIAQREQAVLERQ